MSILKLYCWLWTSFNFCNDQDNVQCWKPEQTGGGRGDTSEDGASEGDTISSWSWKHNGIASKRALMWSWKTYWYEISVGPHVNFVRKICNSIFLIKIQMQNTTKYLSERIDFLLKKKQTKKLNLILFRKFTLCFFRLKMYWGKVHGSYIWANIQHCLQTFQWV